MRRMLFGTNAVALRLGTLGVHHTVDESNAPKLRTTPSPSGAPVNPAKGNTAADAKNPPGIRSSQAKQLELDTFERDFLERFIHVPQGVLEVSDSKRNASRDQHSIQNTTGIASQGYNSRQEDPANLGLDRPNAFDALVGIYAPCFEEYIFQHTSALANVITNSFIEHREEVVEVKPVPEDPFKHNQALVDPYVVYIWRLLSALFESEDTEDESRGSKTHHRAVLMYLETLLNDQISQFETEENVFSIRYYSSLAADKMLRYVKARVPLPPGATEIDEFMVWVSLFYAIRSGNREVALEVGRIASKDSPEFQEALKEYFAPFGSGISRSVSDLLRNNLEHYCRSSKNYPYKKLCLSVLAGRADGVEGLLPTIEDHIWYRMLLSRGSERERSELQDLITRTLQTGGDTSSSAYSLMTSFFYFLGLNFQKGLDCLRSSPDLQHHYYNILIYLMDKGVIPKENSQGARTEYFTSRNKYIVRIFKSSVRVAFMYSFLLEKEEAMELLNMLFLENHNTRELVVILQDRSFMNHFVFGSYTLDQFCVDLMLSVLHKMYLMKDYDNVRYVCLDLCRLHEFREEDLLQIVSLLYNSLVPQMLQYYYLDDVGKAQIRDKVEQSMLVIPEQMSGIQEATTFNTAFKLILFFYFADIYHQCLRTNDSVGLFKSAEKATDALFNDILDSLEGQLAMKSPSQAARDGRFDVVTILQTFDDQFKGYAEARDHLCRAIVLSSRMLVDLYEAETRRGHQATIIINRIEKIRSLISNPQLRSHFHPPDLAEVQRRLVAI